MSEAARWFGHYSIILAKIVSQGGWHLLGAMLRDLRDEIALAARINRRQKRPSTYQTLESADDPEPKLS